MRRQQSPFNGRQYIGNKHHMEVHNFDNEKPTCEIDKIKSKHVVTYTPDTKANAIANGYDNCAHCIGGSTR